MLKLLKYTLYKYLVKYLWLDINRIQGSMMYKANKFINIMVLSALWMYNQGNSSISWFKVYKVPTTPYISSSLESHKVSQIKKDQMKVIMKLSYKKMFSMISLLNQKKISSSKCIQQSNNLICMSVHIYLWICV